VNEKERQVRELREALVGFLDHFEWMFNSDWEHTLACITSGYMIDPEGTFLNPKVDDPYSNWTNRGSLLDAYQRLSALLHEAGLRWEPDYEL